MKGIFALPRQVGQPIELFKLDNVDLVISKVDKIINHNKQHVLVDDTETDGISYYHILENIEKAKCLSIKT